MKARLSQIQAAEARCWARWDRTNEARWVYAIIKLERLLPASGRI